MVGFHSSCEGGNEFTVPPNTGGRLAILKAKNGWRFPLLQCLVRAVGFEQIAEPASC
jgi:hypothetical protein